jgi:hypothetical protein
VRLYHVTDRDSAEKILSDGFEDSEVIHDDSEVLIGVWVADRCLAHEEDVGPRLGPVADVALSMVLPDDRVEQYERREPGQSYREFCVPARLLNEFEVTTMEDIEDVDLAERRRLGDPLATP